MEVGSRNADTLKEAPAKPIGRSAPDTGAGKAGTPRVRRPCAVSLGRHGGLVWRGLRLLILLSLCLAATSIIALVVVLFFAGQAFGAGRVSVVAGGVLSTVSAAGVLAWRLGSPSWEQALSQVTDR